MPSHPSSTPKSLSPAQCLDVIAIRISKRISTLEGVNLVEYRVAISELRTLLDLVQRARRYVGSGVPQRR
jgi:hypothetical protein